MAHVHKRIAALPGGYPTPMDAAGSFFSKSERHQLALARALYSDPWFWSSMSLTRPSEKSFSRSLKGAVKSFLDRGGILIVLSRLALKTFQPNRRFFLEDGQLKASKPVQNDCPNP